MVTSTADFYDCTVNQAITESGGSSSIYFYNCYVSQNITTVTGINAYYTYFSSSTVSQSAGASTCYFCNGTNFALSSTGNVTQYFCSNIQISGTTSATLNLTNCSMAATLNPTATIQHTNLSAASNFGGTNLLGSNVTQDVGLAMAGNVFNARRSGATTVTVTAIDYYIGLTSNSGAVQVNMPTPTAINQTFIIKDEAGTANTKPVTVTTVGGTITFDGATTYVMNAAYQSVSLVWDGSNYFIY
jgi:hypothetical protein